MSVYFADGDMLSIPIEKDSFYLIKERRLTVRPLTGSFAKSDYGYLGDKKIIEILNEIADSAK